MRPAGVRALWCALVLVCATALAGCGDDEGSVHATPMGWESKTDDTGVRFALPVPVTGPEETRGKADNVVVARRSYASRAGDLTISVQVVRTPEDPGALASKLRPQRAPFTVIDQVESDGGDYEAEVLSNERVDEADQPTYDAHVELSSDEQKAVWWMRTRAFEDFQLVTQVVAFVGPDEQPPESQAQTAFDRLNATVEVPNSLS